MPIRRPGVLGLLLLLGAVTGCEGEAASAVTVPTEAAAVAYVAPAGAPTFCTTLADSARIALIPHAVGALSAETRVIEARLELTGGIDELQAALEEVRAEQAYGRLGSAMEELVDTLSRALDGPLTDADRTDISEDLDAVGQQAQPICRFPS